MGIIIIMENAKSNLEILKELDTGYEIYKIVIIENHIVALPYTGKKVYIYNINSMKKEKEIKLSKDDIRDIIGAGDYIYISASEIVEKWGKDLNKRSKKSKPQANIIQCLSEYEGCLFTGNDEGN